MSEDREQAWLDGLKTGDRVLIHSSRYGSKGFASAFVKRRTPTGRIIIDIGLSETAFDKNGVEMNGDTYHCSRIQEPTQERVDEMRHDRAVARVRKMLDAVNLRKLSLEELVKLEAMVKPHLPAPKSPPVADKVGDLREAPYNPRTITPEKLAMMKKSLAEFGDLSGIVFNAATGRLVGGHQRLKHLDPDWPIIKEAVADSRGTVALGHIVTPWGALTYREVQWPEAKEKAANIAANKHGGEFEYAPLKDLLTELNDGALDMEVVGFDEEELKALLTEVPEAAGPDESQVARSVTCPHCHKTFTPRNGDE